jgi:hypothetical protein
MNNSAANWENLPLIHVERMCRYVTDDGAVASYFRIPRHEVVAIRAKIPKIEPPKEPYLPRDHHNINSSNRKEECAAEDGSRRLLIALERMFERFARKHCITIEKAQELQLSGYRA